MKNNILTEKEIEEMTTEERLENLKRLENLAIPLCIEEIRIPIYFGQDERTKEIWIDEDSIYSELKEKLETIKNNPRDFLEVVEDKQYDIVVRTLKEMDLEKDFSIFALKNLEKEGFYWDIQRHLFVKRNYNLDKEVED